MAPPPYQLRSAGPEDEGFLFHLYCTTRAEEVAAWGWPPVQRDLFLQMQYRGLTQQYAQLRDTEHQLILRDGHPAGRLLVARWPEQLRVVDVALLPEYRGSGLGTALLRALQAEAKEAGKPLRLRVLKTNPAARLYARLGFVPLDDDGLYVQMEWRAA
jgi:GNAT superfamily N-acetyltransferase